MRLIVSFACAVILICLLAVPGHAEKRVALIIGNGAYRNEPALPLRLYASWQWGGYLIYRLWPSIPVFDDGRTDFYGPPFVLEGLRVWEVRPDWSEILARDGVNAALVPVDSALGTVLRERADWKLVYEDRVALMFVKIENQK